MSKALSSERVPVLRAEEVRRHYVQKKKHVRPDGTVARRAVVKAVDGVSFAIAPGEIAGVIGESGCGKSTLGRLLVRLEKCTAGGIYLDGTDMEALYRGDRLAFRRQTQMVFQNPFDTFDPRHSIGKILTDTMKLHHIGGSEAERRELAVQELASAGLLPAESFLDRFPYELSGGQLQRISILRSMLLGPKVMVADEPVSMLDVSIRADIINLLYETTRRENTAMVFISHDITTTRYVSDTIAVMYLGRIVELGQADEVVTNPQHPYTQALISNCGSIDPREKRQAIHLPGEPPTPVDIPAGCPFRPRCPRAAAACREREQTLRDAGANHFVCCSQVTGL